MMQEESQERLPDTLTPKDEAISFEKVNITQMPWGRLISCQPFLESVDLVNSFSFGRSETCSVMTTGQHFPTNTLYSISKVHFVIEKHEDNFIYILDLSKNGTYVNQRKLGVNNKKILQSDDVIAISQPSNSYYVFRSLQVVEDFLPPELIPKYVNIRLLGRGSCGEVRLVKDRDTFNEYAIKKIMLEQSNSSLKHKINHPTKIINEIEILRSLVHPSVIKCEEIVQCDREIYLILEFCAGGELTRRVLESPMTEDNVKFYFLQMLYAVQYLHFNGVIHRDLKPDNILLLDQRRETILKITDFGLSKITNASDMTTMCGTLRFVAPEVINNAFRAYGEYGKKVDVWSLGVILFFMISRSYPFSGENNTVLAKNIVQCAFEMTGGIWCNVSPEVRNLIQKILVILPKKRASMFQIINHPWIKKDCGVKYRVENLLQQEGLENPLQDLVLEPPEKKFKFNKNPHSSSSSSGNLDSTLVYTNNGSNYSSEHTICC